MFGFRELEWESSINDAMAGEEGSPTATTDASLPLQHRLQVSSTARLPSTLPPHHYIDITCIIEALVSLHIPHEQLPRDIYIATLYLKHNILHWLYCTSDFSSHTSCL